MLEKQEEKKQGRWVRGTTEENCCVSSTGLVGRYKSHSNGYRLVASGPSEMQEMNFRALESGPKGAKGAKRRSYTLLRERLEEWP